MAITISAGGTQLPSPIEMQVEDEIIWSEDSGRDLSGLFSGDVIATKKAVTVTWGILTEQEVTLIQNRLTAGYVPVTFRDAGSNMTISSYRGTLSKTFLGEFGSVTYFKQVSVKIVQR